MLFDFNKFKCALGHHNKNNLVVKQLRTRLPVGVTSENGRLVLYYNNVLVSMVERSCDCCTRKSYRLGGYDVFPGGSFNVTAERRYRPESDKADLLNCFESTLQRPLELSFREHYPEPLFESYIFTPLRELLALVAGISEAADDQLLERLRTDAAGVAKIDILVNAWYDNPDFSFTYSDYHNKETINGLRKELSL